MNQTLSLYRLQQIDSQIDRAQLTLQAIEKKLEDDASLRQVKDQAQVAEDAHQTAERNLHQAEAAVQDQHIKCEQAEASLYGGSVRSPKELQDLQNDVAALKRHLATLEDRLLEAMVAVDEAKQKAVDAREALQAAQAKWGEDNQSLTQDRTYCQKELQKLSTERDALTGTISPENSSLYDQLRQQRRGVAVATITEDTCNACGARLTPAQAQAVRSASQMARCPSCGRILYCC